VNHDKVLTHRYILSELWGPLAEKYTHYLRIYIFGCVKNWAMPWGQRAIFRRSLESGTDS